MEGFPTYSSVCSRCDGEVRLAVEQFRGTMHPESDQYYVDMALKCFCDSIPVRSFPHQDKYELPDHWVR